MPLRRKKVVNMRKGNPSKRWTVKEIQEWIREKTQEANKIAQEFTRRMAGGDNDPRYSKEILRMQKKTGQKRTGIGQTIKNMLRKKKEDLLKQVRGLRQLDNFHHQVLNEEEQKRKKNRAYETFDKNFGGLDRETWEAMTDVFNGLNIGEWNVESDYVSSNIVTNLELNYPTEEIIEAWKSVLVEKYDEKGKMYRTTPAGKTSYTLVQEVNKYLKDHFGNDYDQ